MSSAEVDPVHIRALRALAALAPGETRPKRLTHWLTGVNWLPLRDLRAFEPGTEDRELGVGVDWSKADRVSLQRMLGRQLLHPDEPILHAGWLWLCGTDPTAGDVATPLTMAPITVERRSSRPIRGDSVGLGRVNLSADDEFQLAPGLLDHPEFLADVPLDIVDGNLDRVGAWIDAATAELGLASQPTLIEADSPVVNDIRLQRADGMRVVVGLGIFALRPSSEQAGTGASLRAWASVSSEVSAFASLYRSSTDEQPDQAACGVGERFDEDGRLRNSSPLTPAQRRAVSNALGERLSVVAGPPGTGKSQVVVATALEAIARGQSVLVAASSDAAVNALVELFESAPGPNPMVAGSGRRRRELADHLASGRTHWVTSEVLEQRRGEQANAMRAAERLHRAVSDQLVDELTAATLSDAAVQSARVAAPGLFEVDADLQRASTWANRGVQPDERASRWRRWRTRRRLERLQTLARCGADVSAGELADAVDTAVRRRRVADLEASGGVDVSDLWPALAQANTVLRRANGELVEGLTHDRSRADRRSIRATAAIASALRSGGALGRKKIAEVPAAEITEAVPLWVASVRGLDDLLPRTAAMFDLVIIDEASQVDQVSAAGALLRARSAAVIGDPQQLRHVSFTSDADIARAIDDNGLSGTDVAALLDVRRLSLFDAVAATVRVTELSEHFRSRPHLIEFSAQRFYPGRLDLATRHPDVDAVDAIEVVHLDGKRVEGVNDDEVERILSLLRTDIAAGRSSIGVVTPFRDQHDALEAAFTDKLSIDEIADLRLRLGTVHGFQGGQRDRVYVSLGLDDDSRPGSLRFVNDPHLFNVMITRARHEMVVLSSGGAGTSGLLHDYLRHAERASSDDGVDDAGPLSNDRGWASAVRRELDHAGIASVQGYRTGRHPIDLLIRRGERAPIAVICGVHADGPDEHIARHLHLLDGRWQVVEVFETGWRHRLTDFAVELAAGTRPV